MKVNKRVVIKCSLLLFLYDVSQSQKQLNESREQHRAAPAQARMTVPRRSGIFCQIFDDLFSRRP